MIRQLSYFFWDVMSNVINDKENNVWPQCQRIWVWKTLRMRKTRKRKLGLTTRAEDQENYHSAPRKMPCRQVFDQKTEGPRRTQEKCQRWRGWWLVESVYFLHTLNQVDHMEWEVPCRDELSFENKHSCKGNLLPLWLLLAEWSQDS